MNKPDGSNDQEKAQELPIRQEEADNHTEEKRQEPAPTDQEPPAQAVFNLVSSQIANGVCYYPVVDKFGNVRELPMLLAIYKINQLDISQKHLLAHSFLETQIRNHGASYGQLANEIGLILSDDPSKPELMRFYNELATNTDSEALSNRAELNKFIGRKINARDFDLGDEASVYLPHGAFTPRTLLDLILSPDVFEPALENQIYIQACQCINAMIKAKKHQAVKSTLDLLEYLEPIEGENISELRGIKCSMIASIVRDLKAEFKNELNPQPIFPQNETAITTKYGHDAAADADPTPQEPKIPVGIPLNEDKEEEVFASRLEQAFQDEADRQIQQQYDSPPPNQLIVPHPEDQVPQRAYNYTGPTICEDVDGLKKTTQSRRRFIRNAALGVLSIGVIVGSGVGINSMLSKDPKQQPAIAVKAPQPKEKPQTAKPQATTPQTAPAPKSTTPPPKNTPKTKKTVAEKPETQQPSTQEAKEAKPSNTLKVPIAIKEKKAFGSDHVTYLVDIGDTKALLENQAWWQAEGWKATTRMMPKALILTRKDGATFEIPAKHSFTDQELAAKELTLKQQ